MEFKIPNKIEELEDGAYEGQYLCVKSRTDFSELVPEDATSFVRELTFELSNKEVLCVEEQDVFDKLHSVVRDFELLEPSNKSHILDGLCSNLTCLIPSISSLCSTPSETSEDAAALSDAIQSHRNALKIYTYFLHCIYLTGEKGAASAAAEAVPVKPGKGRQTKKRHVAAGWDWEIQRTAVMRPLALAAALDNDLLQLFRGAKPDEALVMLFQMTAMALLESPVAVRDKEAKEYSGIMLAHCALRYGQLPHTVSALMHALHKHEHLPGHLADVVALSELKLRDGRLASAALQEAGRGDPRQYARDAGGAKNVAEFLVALADRLPRLVAKNLSLVMPHLHGEAYPLRNAVVAVCGKMVAKVFRDPVAENAGGEASRLRSKQGLLEVLLERARDVSAYVRSRVLQTWGYLCEEEAVPLGHWNAVAALAIGRLEDKSSIVRKNALELLTVMLEKNIFQGNLDPEPVEASLELYQAHLARLKPPPAPEEQRPEGEDGGDGEEGAAAAETGDAGAGAEEGEGRRDGETEEEAAEQPAMQEEETQTQTQTQDNEGLQQGRQEGGGADVAAAAAGGGEELLAHVTYEEGRRTVAMLDSMLSYSRCMSRAMPVLQQLLASNTASDVEHTIGCLIVAHKFKIDGAEHALRKMLPLVFSQEQKIRDAVEQAVATLYISDVPQAAAARNLVELTFQAGLGDLTSLEALVASFVRRGDITSTMIACLWDIFTFGQPGVTAQHSRGALLVLTMAAAASPEILSKHTQPLLDIGFGRKAREDALLARHACIALQRLSPRDRAALHGGHRVYAALAAMVADSPLPEHSWYSAAEQAVKTIYCLHPTPEAFSCALLARMADRLFRGSVPAEASPVLRPGAGGGGVAGGATSSSGAGGAGGARAGDGEGAADAAADGPGSQEQQQQQEEEEEVSGVSGVITHGEGDRQRKAEHEGGGEEEEAGTGSSVSTAGGLEVHGRGGGPAAPAVPTCAPSRTAAGVSAEAAAGAPKGIPVAALSRFLFAVGQVALHHLVYVEQCSKAVQRLRADRERAVAQAAADRHDAALAGGAAARGDGSEDEVDAPPPNQKGQEEEGEEEEEGENINAELGVAASADAELDTLQDAAEREIISGGGDGRRQLIGHIAPIVGKLCRASALLHQHACLRSSAMLALCKLMAVDSGFCDANLQLLFTVVQNAAEASVRSNGIIALGDLAFRFPNLVEPWTEHMYARLRDTSPTVRKNAVMVLSHLILNDMMKVKGYISELALCIRDADERIAALVKLFFHELAKKGNNPIYNLLPDILSRLSSMPALAQETLREVMQFLIANIDKDKQMEGLIEKLCNRFPGTQDVKQWRDIAFCLSLLKITEKGVKKMMDAFKSFKSALVDDEIMEHFLAIVARAKKSAKPELKVAVEEFEEKMLKCHAEKKEEEAAAGNARSHQQQGQGQGQAASSNSQEGEGEEGNEEEPPSGEEGQEREVGTAKKARAKGKEGRSHEEARASDDADHDGDNEEGSSMAAAAGGAVAGSARAQAKTRRRLVTPAARNGRGSAARQPSSARRRPKAESNGAGADDDGEGPGLAEEAKKPHQSRRPPRRLPLKEQLAAENVSSDGDDDGECTSEVPDEHADSPEHSSQASDQENVPPAPPRSRPLTKA